MAMVVIAELAVCVNCTHLIANGEVFESHEDITNAHADRITEFYGVAPHLVLGGEDLGISSRACELCGEESEGERFSASELGPAGSVSVSAGVVCGECGQHITKDSEGIWRDATGGDGCEGGVHAPGVHTSESPYMLSGEGSVEVSHETVTSTLGGQTYCKSCGHGGCED